MIDTSHSTEPTKTRDHVQRKGPVPRRHFSFQGNDLESCDNVCVRSIIDQLGEKLDVGKPRVQRRMKHSSFQSINIQRTNTSEPKSRSRSMMISRFDHVIPVGLRDVVPHTHESSQRCNDALEESQMHSSYGSLQPPPSPNFHLSNTSCDQFNGSSPGSLGSCRSRWGLSKRLNHNDLPPAFRDSLDTSILGSNTTRQRHSAQVGSSSVNLGKHHRRPSKLQRRWPPLPRKVRRPSQQELLESSLSDLRLMARVQSQIPSFEPPPLPLFSPESDHQVQEDVLVSSSSHLFLNEGEAENRDGQGSSSVVQPDILGLPSPEAISGLASAIKSGKCKGSLRIRWSGPEVFFIEGRRHKSFQPLYYDDLLEDRFQSVSEHSANKPLLVDRFGARVNDSSPGLPTRPRRYDDDDDWSDYEDEECNGQQGPSDPSSQSGSDDIPMSPPMIWITRLDEDGTGSSLHWWRVRRVWDNPRLDSLEKDRIIPDEDLLNTLKNLSGLPAIPTELLLEHGNKVAETADAKPLLPWSIQKVYDIDGEIMDELCSLSEISVEEGAMLDAIVAFAKETQVPSSPQQELSSSLVQDDWNTQPLDTMVPRVPLLDPRANLEESISVLGTDDTLSLGDSKAEMLTPTSKARSMALSNIKVSVVNSPSTSSTAMDSITRGSSDELVFPSKGVVPLSDLAGNRKDRPEVTLETKDKTKKKKKRDHGTLASLLSPPPVLKFFDLPD